MRFVSPAARSTTGGGGFAGRLRGALKGTVANPVGELVETTTAGKSGLSYDPVSDQYAYVWKTDKSWAKKTGQFVLKLADGSVHTFDVTFKK